MASGFFALLDDISALMGDVVVMSKITTKKTAGILGDDLAVNAEKASGFVSSREIPVLWSITKGSFLNKLIILPIAFLLSAFIPSAVTVILVCGGIYLAYEGSEKIYDFLIGHHQEFDRKSNEQDSLNNLDLDAEQKKIKSAIITDFILSVEIVIIALGTVIEEPLLFQIIVVSIVACIATIGVYGIVALIVRMDDLGLKLIRMSSGKRTVLFTVGNLLVNALPLIIKSLSVVGTIALVLVAGGIFNHHVKFFHTFLENLPGFVRDFLVGFSVGIVVVLFVTLSKKLLKK
ncbi:DUF808 domain-containing protein [Flavobacteriaceae bacterium]|jgi:uncharacterized protein|nr:DUF808 domain-containing protein [Flavobacteriaceae bacterium]